MAKRLRSISYGFTRLLGLVILALVLLGAAGIGWLRNILAGMVLLSEVDLSPGDRIQIDEYQGEVVSIGIRALRLRDVDGVMHDIPHPTLVDQPLSGFPDCGDITCTMDFTINSDAEPTEILEILRILIGLAPLASPRRRPEAFLASSPEPGAPLHVRVLAYPCSSEHREAFRSDVLRRVARRF